MTIRNAQTPMWIRTTINNQHLSHASFIEQINQGYARHFRKQHHSAFAARYLGYTSRNLSDRWQKPALALFYDVNSPNEFNGLNRWSSCFEHFRKELSKRFKVSDYLRDVLVKRLNQHTYDWGLSKSEITCDSYKSYIHACLRFNYVPSFDIRWIDNKGWGLVAKEALYPFMFIGLYTGQLKLSLHAGLAERFRRRHNKYIWLLTYNTAFCVDAEMYGNHTRFINHDEEGSNRVVTFSLQIANDKEKIPVPHNGFILGFDPQRPQNAVFEEEEEVVWDYGPGYHFD